MKQGSNKEIGPKDIFEIASNKAVLENPTANNCPIGEITGNRNLNTADENKLIQFDALSHYKKYSDIFDYDDVPEDERNEVAQSVAAWVLESLDNTSA